MKKQSILYLVLFVLTLIPLSACTSNPTPDQTTMDSTTPQSTERSIDAVAEIRLNALNTIFDTLASQHKNLFANTSRQALETQRDTIAAQIADMSDPDFYFALKNLIASVGDSHTGIYYSDSIYKHLMALPFAVAPFENDWHLLMIESENSAYLGQKLIAINDTPIEKVYEKSKTIMSFDNPVFAASQFSNTINFKEALEYLGVVEKDAPIRLSIQADDGTVSTCLVTPQSESEIMTADIVSLGQDVRAETFPEGYYRTLALDEDHFMIQYNTCAEAPDLSMAAFIEAVENQMTAHHYQNLIIDMRYNGGGNSQIFKPMIDALKRLKTENDFKVYTLIGANTFSSAIINAVQTKDTLDSTFVGTPTGGSANHFGELKNFDLPEINCTVYYSTKYFEMIEDYDKDSLYPDVAIAHTFDDYKAGVDAEIEWIMAQ